jgi:pyridoxamine--pyruvate transaminase
VQELGLELWPVSEAIAASCTTAVKLPAGLEDEALRMRMRRTYGVMISGGYGDLAGKLFRLSHMGFAANPLHLVAQLGALERTLADLGGNVALGRGVGAALEVLARGLGFLGGTENYYGER